MVVLSGAQGKLVLHVWARCEGKQGSSLGAAKALQQQTLPPVDYASDCKTNQGTGNGQNASRKRIAV
jgi:hypothetical protein